MKTRILGKDLTVSAIGLGIMGMDHAYGKAADRGEMIELIRHSIALGGNFFDTAPIYGKANEMLLGEAVKGIRHQAVIATKFGIVGQTHSASGVENVLDSRPNPSANKWTNPYVICKPTTSICITSTALTRMYPPRR